MDEPLPKLYFIICQTGCTCCSDENHIRGPYASQADAERRINFWLKGDGFFPLASQYARRGRYSVEEVEVEEISKNRWIINDIVHQVVPVHDVPEDGRGSDSDKFCHYYEWL